jgi:hypothetical protein
MAMKLIPNNVDIYEQFRRRDQFVKMVEKWSSKSARGGRIDLKELLKHSGVQCHYVGENLAGFELVNKEAYTMFVLKWAA